MAECPAGRTNRGIRTQFRLGTPGLGLLKGLYPIHVRDIMDAEQSSQTDVPSALDIVSPSKGTKTLTVREYEETIHKLERENFDIKLKLHFYENPKNICKGKSGSSSEKDTVQIFLDLSLETESLRKNLAYKEKVLQDTLQRAEKYELDFKELEDKYAELQNELSSLSELPSKQEFLSLLDEKENILKQNELLEQALIEKDQEIQGINEKIEILANQNSLLEEKIRKRSLAIQSFVYKNVKEEAMFPEELRNIVFSATQAAKNQNKDGLVVAMKSFSSALNKIMSSSVNMLLNESEEKENNGSPRAKCLKEEFLEKSSAFLPSQTETFTELSHIEALNDVLSGRNTSSCKQFDSLNSTVHDSYVKGKTFHESSVNVSEKNILEFLKFSPGSTQSVEEEKLMLPTRYSSQLCSAGENLIDIETISLPSVSSDLMHQDGLSKSEVSLLSNNAEEYQLIKENEKLKLEIKEKIRAIEELRATCNELKFRSVYFQKREDDALKASKCYSACTQTDIAGSGSNLLNEYEKTKLQKDAKLSNNVDELREDILLLLLAIEDKNKELVDIKQALATVQEDLNKALNTSSDIIDKDYMNERNGLHERLAISSSVNVELMKHLRNLEAFMEDLLQHKFDSSMESINEKSDFLSNVSRCLNESLKLSNVLSEHLSICEGSKLFEECESILYRSSSYCDSKSLPELNVSERTVPAQHSSSYPGTHHLEEYIPFVRKKDERMSKVLDSCQLCGRCWQQLNSFPENKLDDTNLKQVLPFKCIPYASSDSDIWSEPDRNVSMQRIGISLQNSPVTSKSPRKLRLKEKRMANKLSSNLDTSSSEMQRWSRQRRHGSVSHRLFVRESTNNVDFASEKFYFLLAEKYSKLNMLLGALENVKDSGVTSEIWMRMNTVVTCVKEALQKIHVAKENAKNFPSTICEKCVMLELFMDLKACHKEADICIGNLPVENGILLEFQKEVHLLKEACKEPFSLLSESIVKRSQSTQSDSASDNEQAVISELKNAYFDLNVKNKNLNKSLEEVGILLSKEKEALKSVKSENKELCSQINNLTEELLKIEQKGETLYARNEEVVRELMSVNRKNVELTSTLTDLEEKKKRSSITLDELTEELQLNKSDLVDNEKLKICELEDALVDLNDKNKSLNKSLEEVNIFLIQEKERLESAKSENLKLCNQINDLEKELLETKQQELISYKNEELAKELKDLRRKNLELNSSLNELEEKKKETGVALEMLQSAKSKNLELHNQINNLKKELLDLKQKKLSSESLKLVEKSTSMTGKSIELNSSIKDIEDSCSAWEMLKLENLDLFSQISNLEKELLDLKQKELITTLKNEELSEELTRVNRKNSDLNSSLKDIEKKRKLSKTALDQMTDEMQKTKLELDAEKIKISELEDAIINLNNKNKNLNKSMEAVKRLLSEEKGMLQLAKSENLDLSYQINNLKEELFGMQQKEKHLSLKNQEIVEELESVNTNNFELSSTLKDLEEKRKESSVALDQLTAELQNNKLVLVNMNKKCLEYEEKLNEQISIRKECEEKLKHLEFTSNSEKEILYSNIHDLGIEKNNYQEDLESIKNEKLSLEKENAVLSASLQSKCKELSSLQETINIILESKETLSSKCNNLETELENARKNWQSLQKKCSMYEKEVLMKFKANEEEYCQQLKELETKSLNEKEKLLSEISKLTLEREDILQKLNAEKECYERLIIEKEELNRKVTERCEQISSLLLLNEELKMKQQKLLHRKEFFEKALHSSNTECDNLNKDLKCMRETLQNLESKCMMYEKEIVATAGMKDSLIECLLNITSEFSAQRQKLNELCKAYGKESNEVCDKTSVSELIPVIDDDNVIILCRNLCIESKRLMQSVDIMLELLKSFYLKSLEIKNVEEKCNLKTASMSKQIEFHKTEGDHLKSQNDNFQHVIDELRKSILEKEKSIQCSAYELHSLKEKIHNSQAEIEKGNELLKRKDDEVTKLQERVFNLQSYVNTIIADKANVQPKSPSTKLLNMKADSVSSTSQLPSPSSLRQASKAIQTIDYEDQSQSADESFISVSTLEREKNSCCEKYLKKYQSLQTKLTLCKKRIEILEKEKKDLREHYLNQIKTSSTSEDNEESVNAKLVDLESKLEQKKAFISELKAELLKTCNSLIDKEKEVDDLKEKLCEAERKSKSSTSEISVGSIGSPKTVDANIRKLRNYKWKLIQTIFDIQRKFYEKRGIHLNYIDKFRDHVNSLYLMQLSHSLSKSESMPLLESHNLNQLSDPIGDKFKSLVGLELDIECLENLKIFLNRFFVPSMLQTSKDLSCEVTLEKKLSLEPEIGKLDSSKFETSGSLGISFPAFVSDDLMLEDKVSTDKTLSFENFVSNVSHHLDCFENLFTAISKRQWLESLDLPAKKTVDKVEIRPLLLKIFEEIKNLQERADKLFSFNILLKNLDFVVTPSIPFHFSRPDMSDLESLMSEETIGISRSESPLSYEELCPLKLPCPETLTLEEQAMESKAAGDKGIVTQTYGTKVTTIGSSCDSVCQRSHYSSPDLGIESDPNHESSAPEQKEESINMYQKIIVEEKKFILKPQQKTAFTATESAGRFKGIKFSESLYSIGKLPNYELLKREIQESLVGIKSVLSRTGDGLHHVAKYTSPRKTLEYSTLKAIKDSCANIEVCLKEAYSLIGKFWIAPCPTEKEWKALVEENQSLTKQLTNFREMIPKQEREYKKATRKLEQAQLINANMEKKISKKLVKTKKNIRQAELKLLGNLCQNLPPVPKYPFEQANLVPQTEDV